ncbi:MAG: ATP-dependent helicase, partial [Bacteroidetes bacterium]
MYVKPENWKPSDGLTLEPNALKVVTESKDNYLVVAGPGAGKTELLAQRAGFLLQTNSCLFPKKILAISFKRDAAKNLNDRVEKRCEKHLAVRFNSVTFDTFAKGILDRFIHGLPERYKPITYEVLLDYRDVE